MNKIVIFNVGGALSSYAVFGEKKVVIDIGASSTFSPVDDFLKPLAEKEIFDIGIEVFNKGKFLIDQLFLSHLDKDHISDYEKFSALFYPNYMTCPNDNNKQNADFKANTELLGDSINSRNAVLEDMQRSRSPESLNEYGMSVTNPLVSVIDEISLFYIKPTLCENEELLNSGYANNISLVLFVQVGDKTLVLPGDMLKEGMKYLIDNDVPFKKVLQDEGIDYLVAPHHGLQTAFSVSLFETISGNKTRLNIISEKVREEESNENRSDVDARYYSSDYSTGENSLDKNGVKTSTGHIVINFDADVAEVKQYSDIKDVIEEFSV